MKAAQAHAVLALRQVGCTHPLIEDLFRSPMSRVLLRDESEKLVELCADREISIAKDYQPTLQDIAGEVKSIRRFLDPADTERTG
tara:strand:+ start:5785 stop:6039 length:255 start_codon:yes stop_codon:yes gene_type:complete